MATMTNATQMFTSCSALETIYATSFTNVISSSGSMFYGYNKLVGGADGFVPSSTSAGSVCKLGAGGVLTNPNSDVREWFRVFVYDDGTLDFTVSGSADGSKTLLDIRAAVRQREVPGRGRHPRTQLPHAVPNGVDALRHGDAGRREHELLVLRAQRHHLVRGLGNLANVASMRYAFTSCTGAPPGARRPAASPEGSPPWEFPRRPGGSGWGIQPCRRSRPCSWRTPAWYPRAPRARAPHPSSPRCSPGPTAKPRRCPTRGPTPQLAPRSSSFAG